MFIDLGGGMEGEEKENVLKCLGRGGIPPQLDPPLAPLHPSRILPFTSLYLSPAKVSTMMSMKQATSPVRMPIMAQMNQR